MPKHTQRPESKADSFEPFHGLATINGPFFDALHAAGQTYSRLCLAWQEAALHSANEGLKRNGELSAALGECQNWLDVFRLHQQWTLSAAQDLLKDFDQFSRLSPHLTISGRQDGTRAPGPDKQNS